MHQGDADTQGTGGEPTDLELVASALGGDSHALNDLIRRHQAWIYNLALRMLWDSRDAEDATQEVLIKIVTNLSSFRGESAFRTWAYRVTVNHVLDCKRCRAEQAVTSFDCYSKALDRLPSDEIADESSMAADMLVLVEEAKVGCMIGMLLCLSREQRVVFVLGEIFGVSDALGGEVLGVSRDTFRQQLSRARRQLYAFMRGQCGLVDPTNPCRCARKTRAFISAGIVDPSRLQFSRAYQARVRHVADGRAKALEEQVDATCARLFREHSVFEPPDFVARLRAMLGSERLKTVLDEPPS